MSDRKHPRTDDPDVDGSHPIPEPKKHHFEPIELQKKQLDKLLERIDKPVHIPGRPIQKKTDREPKDYVKNVQGSSAGAGSGEFHVYRAGRRREYARLKNMELESKEVPFLFFFFFFQDDRLYQRETMDEEQGTVHANQFLLLI